MFGLSSIFWFLFAFSLIIFILLVLLLPETNRGLAGNGTRKLPKLQAPLICILKDCEDMLLESKTTHLSLTMYTFTKPFTVVTRLDTLPSLLTGSFSFVSDFSPSHDLRIMTSETLVP